MDKRFEKFTEQILHTIDTKFREFKEDLLRDMREKYKTLETELFAINERVTNLESTTCEIESMKEEIKILKRKIKQQENYPVSSEIRINEIPFVENENLTNIFCNICNIINTPIPNIKSIYRLRNQNNKHKRNSRDGVIIVKFWSAYDKNFLFKSLANHRKLNKGFAFRLRDIDFNSDSKFYLNENLTKSNFDIFKAAIRLKKNKIICSAFTMRGFVYIKKQINDDPMQVDEIERLNQLFPGQDDQVAYSGNRI